MADNIDEIIREVLRRMGAQKEAALLDGIVYSEAFMQKMCAYDLRRTSSMAVSELPVDVPVFIPELKLGQLMAIYSGIPCDAVSEAAIAVLAQGVRVHVLSELSQYHTIKLGKTPYAKRFTEAYAFLAESGLRVEGEEKCAPLKEDKAAKRGGVFTEKDAIQCVENGMKRVTLEKGVVITPLARDYARYKNLAIEKE